MNIVNVGDPKNVSLAFGQSLSVSCDGTMVAEVVSGLGLTAGATISSTHGTGTVGPFSSAGVVKLTVTGRDGAYGLNVPADFPQEDLISASDPAALSASFPPAANAGKTATVGDSLYIASDGLWRSLPAPAANDYVTTKMWTILGSDQTAASAFGWTSGDTRTTFCVSLEVEVDEVDAIAFVLANRATSGAAQITGMTVAQCPAWDSYGNNANFSGNQKAVTFNGGKSTLTMPAASGVATGNGYTDTDWYITDFVPLYAAASARSDGVPRAAITVRTEYATTTGSEQITTWAAGSTGWGGTNQDDLGRFMFPGFSHGTGTELTGAFSGAQSTTRANNIFGVLVRSKRRGMTFITVGDSNDAGSQLPSYQRGYPMQAAIAMTTSTSPVGFVNCGMPGATTQQFTYLGNKLLTALDAVGACPHIAVFNGFTPNDHSATGVLVTTLGMPRSGVVAFLALCKKLGIKALLRNGIPRNNGAGGTDWDAAMDARRLTANTGLTSYGPPVLDFNGVCNDGGTPQHLKAGTYVDGLHANQATQVVWGNLLTDAISKYRP